MVWFVYTANLRPNSFSAVSCGNITISPEDTVRQITNTILSIVPPDEKTKRNSKHSLAISTCFGHVHAFLNDTDSVWNKLDDCETNDQCVMLIKKPKSSAREMLKAHSWANLSISDPHFHSQLDGTLHADTRKHHKYRMKKKQSSDLQLVPERRDQIETWIEEQNTHLESRKTKCDDSARISLPLSDTSKQNEINNNDVKSLPRNMVSNQRLFSSERNLSNLDSNSNIKSGPKRNESYSEIRPQTVGAKHFVSRTERSESAERHFTNSSKCGPLKPPRMELKQSSTVTQSMDNSVPYGVRERTHTFQTGQKQIMNSLHGNIQNTHRTDKKAMQNFTEGYSANRIGQDDSRRSEFGHRAANTKSTGMEHDVTHQNGHLIRTEGQGVNNMRDIKNYNSQQSAKIGGAHSSENMKSYVPVQSYRETNVKKTNPFYSHYQNHEIILRNSETGYSMSNTPKNPQQGYNSQTAYYSNVERRRQSEGNYRTSYVIQNIQNMSQKINVSSSRSEEKIQNLNGENNYSGKWHSARLSIEDEVSPKVVNVSHMPENFPKGSNHKISNAQTLSNNFRHEPCYGSLDIHERNQIEIDDKLFQECEKNRLYFDVADRHKNEENVVKSADTNSQNQDDNQIKSDELYGKDVHGVILKQEVDQDPVIHSHSMGDLTAGLTFSLIGQLKSDSMLTLPASSCDLDQDGSGDSVLFSSNQDPNFNVVCDSVTKVENEKSVTKPRRTLPRAPGDANEKKKHYTELMQMKIRSASSRNTHSSPQSSPEIDHNMNETPLDREVSDLLQQEDELGARLTPQELLPADNNKNGRHISMKDVYTSESPQVRHLSGDSAQTTRVSHGSTVDSGYLTNDPENDFYSTSSYTLSIQRSAQNIYSRVQDQNGIIHQVTPRQHANDVNEQKSAQQGFHHYENCYSASQAELMKVGPIMDQGYSQNVPKHKRSSDPCMSSRETMMVRVMEKTKSLSNLNSDAAVRLLHKSGHKKNVDENVDTHFNSPHVNHRTAVYDHHFKPIRLPRSSSSRCVYGMLPSNRQHGRDNTYERDASSLVNNASLFLILQKYRLYPVRINLPNNCSLFEFVQLQDYTIGLPLLRNSPSDQLLTSTPCGKYATLGGPGSAFKPVRNKQNVTNINMIKVAMVTDQLIQSCDVGELAKDDLIVELDGQLIIGANVTTLRSFIQRSGSSIMLTVARKFPEFSADVSVITKSKDTMVLEQELEDMHQKMAMLTIELQHKDKRIQQLNASLAQNANKNYLFLQQNGNVFPTDSFLNGLDENEFIV